MTALTQKDLAANAFRILGLTAGASQSQIDAAARKMRIWQDPAMIPESANHAVSGLLISAKRHTAAEGTDMVLRNLVLGSAALLMMANIALADEKSLDVKKEVPAKAASVDFSRELGVSYASLSSLGSRIDAARQSEDPVALAVASVELAADEKASGKTADVKSTDLAAEAVELAKERFHPMELKSVAAMLSGNSDAAQLTETAARAEQLEQAAKAMKESGARVKAKGIMGTLHVDNRSPETLHIYIDGNLVGTVNPFADGYFYIGQSAWETTYVTARGSDGTVWRSSVSTAVGDYLCPIKE